jgi:hypothetical protein
MKIPPMTALSECLHLFCLRGNGAKMTLEGLHGEEVAKFEDCYKHHRILLAHLGDGQVHVVCDVCGNNWEMSEQAFKDAEKYLGFR